MSNDTIIKECAEDFDSTTSDQNLIKVVPEGNFHDTLGFDFCASRCDDFEIIPDGSNIKANKGDHLAMNAGRTKMWVIKKEEK